MEKTRNLSAWTEQGYAIFAEEGMDGIQVERLARILQLNKSGFYHYFGDLDVFYLELLALHQKKAASYMNDLREAKTIDPGYFEIVVKHKVPVMFQMQLIRTGDPTSVRVADMIDQEEDCILRDTWTDYMGFTDSPDLAVRYLNIVRDMFYARVSLKNMNCLFLRELVTEAKVLMQRMVESNATLEPDESLT